MFALQKIRMFKSKLSFSLAAIALLISALESTAAAQQPAAGSRFDVTNYRIEAQLSPDEHTLRAGADITFVPADATRSVVFELNGSLHVDSVEKNGKALTGFVQDAVGAGALGPNVRIDLGEVVPANQPVTIRIRRGRALEFYTKEYGAPAFGNRFIIAQTDDETMDAYSGPGMLFLASKFFDNPHGGSDERMQREVAYQWWGQTVGLKSFDDAWVSQGLAEWSAFALRESTLSGGQLDSAQREEQERALTFEQTSSIVRAPAALDDQSAAYQSIVYYKGAMVFRMLRETLGREQFNQVLRKFLDQFRNKNAGIDDFERIATQVAGRNMRYFFAQWVEGTGVPEFSVDYQIIRTRGGKFRTRGTVRQNFENLHMPVELTLHSEGDSQTKVLYLDGKSEDFDFESNGQPIAAEVDPNDKILRMSDDLKVSIVARRGIELFHDGQYAEAQQQLETALKLDRNNAWVYYNLGLVYFEQKNWQLALDNFQAALDAVSSKPGWIDTWAHIKRGNAYDAKGDRNKAVFEYNKALQAGSNYDNAQATAKKFIATPYDPKAPAEQAQNGPATFN